MLHKFSKRKSRAITYRSNASNLVSVDFPSAFTVQGYFKVDLAGTAHFGNNISTLLSLGSYSNLQDPGMFHAGLIYYNDTLRLVLNYGQISIFGNFAEVIAPMLKNVSYHIAVEVSSSKVVNIFLNGTLVFSRLCNYSKPFDNGFYFDGRGIGLSYANSIFFGLYNTVTKYSAKEGLTYNGNNFTPV